MVFLSNTDRLILFSNLSSLLTSGIPILEATEILIEDSSKNLKQVLEEFKKSLLQGKTFASTLSLFPESFDPVTINLIASAEKSGNLEKVLKDIVLDTKRNMELNEKVKGALAYPGITGLVFLGIVFIILFYVIPKVADVFSRIKVTIPLPTQILFNISNFLISFWPEVLTFFVILIISLGLLIKYKKQQIFVFVYYIPIFKDVANNLDFTRFTKSLGLMLSSGIPITEALTLSGKTIGNKNTKNALLKITNQISQGQNLGDSMGAYRKYFPQVMINMIKSGEKAGNLETTLLNLSEHFNLLVESQLKNLTTLMEPVLLLFMGLLVAGLMLSVIAPIYQLIGSISPQ